MQDDVRSRAVRVPEELGSRGRNRLSQELLYTSAPQGLKPGSRGFCTVISTQGMPSPLASVLESISGYRPVYPPGDTNAASNPVVYSHLHLNAAGKRYHVLSRIAEYGLDYSQRSNKIAHHVVLDPKELSNGGPAALLEESGFMESAWDGKPRILPTGRAVPASDRTPAVCATWQRHAGDAGWAGVLAEAFLADPDRQVYLVFSPGMDVLSLMSEANTLLPPDRRWETTFSTYFTSLPAGVNCNWRFVLAGSAEANQSRRFVRALRIDLTQKLERAEGGQLVEIARSGSVAARTAAPELDRQESAAKFAFPSVKRTDIPTPGESKPPAVAGDDPIARYPPEPTRGSSPPAVPGKSPSRDRSRTAGSRPGWVTWMIGIMLILSAGGAVAYSLLGERMSDVGKAVPNALALDMEPASDSPNKPLSTKEQPQPEEQLSAVKSPAEVDVLKPSPNAQVPTEEKPEEASGSGSDEITNTPSLTDPKDLPSFDKESEDALSPKTAEQPTLEAEVTSKIEQSASTTPDQNSNNPYYIALPEIESQGTWNPLDLPGEFSIKENTTLQLMLPDINDEEIHLWPEGVKKTTGLAVNSRVLLGEDKFAEFEVKDGRLNFRWIRITEGVQAQSVLLRYCGLLIKDNRGERVLVLHASDETHKLLAVADEKLERTLQRDRDKEPSLLAGHTWTIVGQFSNTENVLSIKEHEALPPIVLPKLTLRSLELVSEGDAVLRFTLAPGDTIDDPRERTGHFIEDGDPSKIATDAYPILAQGKNGRVVVTVRSDLCSELQSQIRDEFRKLLKAIPEGEPNEKEVTVEFKKFKKDLQREATAIGIFRADPSLQVLERTTWRHENSSETFKSMLKDAAELRKAAQKLKKLGASQSLTIDKAKITYPLSRDGETTQMVDVFYRAKADNGTSRNMK